jgi:exportin-T
VRSRDASRIVTDTFSILSTAIAGIDKEGSGLSGQTAIDIAQEAVRVIGDYVGQYGLICIFFRLRLTLDVGWVDINLIVNSEGLKMFYHAIQLPPVAIRIAAADALIETVTKGMPPSDKLQLVKALRPGDLVEQALSGAHQRRLAGSVDLDDEQEELFREKVAKFLNGVGVELCKITDEATALPAEKTEAVQTAQAFLPLVLRFLADEYDDTASAVFPYTQSMLSLYKKEKKRLQHNPNMFSAEQKKFFSELLNVVLAKMKYSSESEWSGSDDDEDSAAFATMRKVGVFILPVFRYS